MMLLCLLMITKKFIIIEGEKQNFKITNNQDLRLFKNSKQKTVNYGIGFDIHRLEKKRKLYLGGTNNSIPFGFKEGILMVTVCYMH